MVIKCAAKWCNANNRDNVDLKFYRFPRALERVRLWKNYSLNSDLDYKKTAYLCSQHFSSMYKTPDGALVYGSNPDVPPPRPCTGFGSGEDIGESIVSAGSFSASPFLSLSSGCGGVMMGEPGPSHSSRIEEIYLPEGVSSPLTSQVSFAIPSTAHSGTLTDVLDESPNLLFLSNPSSIPCHSTPIRAVNISNMVPSSPDDIGCFPLPDVDQSLSSSLWPKKRKLISDLGEGSLADITPRKHALVKLTLAQRDKYRRVDRELKRKTKEMKELKAEGANPLLQAQKLSSHLSSFASQFLASQVRCAKSLPQGRRWTVEEKLMALSLYKSSPRCYSLLSSLFIFPSPSTLKRIISNIPLKAGLNNHLLTAVSHSLKADDSDCLCFLMFDEMSIKKQLQYDSRADRVIGYKDMGSLGTSNLIADHVLVFMVRGVCKKWKQPVSFYFSHGGVKPHELTSLLREVLSALFSVGLNVAALVCDMAACNVKALRDMGVSRDTPYISHDGKRIITVYDPPHLVKCTRNLFMKYDVLHEIGSGDVDGKASWDDIVRTVGEDAKRPWRILPNITKGHINPKGLQRMKVKLAAQIFSQRMCAAICTSITLGTVPPSATGTATFVDFMDKIFDSLNGAGRRPSGGNLLRTSLSINREDRHLKFWSKAAAHFSNLKYVNASSKPPSQEGWVVTLNGFSMLWTKLKDEGLLYFSPRSLNQDPLEHLFGMIRFSCGGNPSPNAVQFTGALKTCILNNLVSKSLKNLNVENDEDLLFLQELKPFLDVEESSSSRGDDLESFQPVEPVDISDDKKLDVGEELSVAYVTGYIAKRLLRGSDCGLCRAGLVHDSNDPELCHIGIYFREYSEQNPSLTYPNLLFVGVVGQCVTIMERILPDISHTGRIKGQIIAVLEENVDFSWFQCPEHKENILKKFLDEIVLLELRWWCTKSNRSIKESFCKLRK